MRTDNLRTAAALIIGVALAIISLVSCSPIRQIERVHTLEANNLLDRYYETQWNRENNQPGEVRQARQAIRTYLHDNK